MSKFRIVEVETWGDEKNQIHFVVEKFNKVRSIFFKDKEEWSVLGRDYGEYGFSPHEFKSSSDASDWVKRRGDWERKNGNVHVVRKVVEKVTL